MNHEKRRQVWLDIRYGYKNWAIAKRYQISVEDVAKVRSEDRKRINAGRKVLKRRAFLKHARRVALSRSKVTTDNGGLA